MGRGNVSLFGLGGNLSLLNGKSFHDGGRNDSLLKGKISPCWRKKGFPVGGGNVSLLKRETFPCWRGIHSLLERDTFLCWRGKIFPVEGGTRTVSLVGEEMFS